MKRESRYRVDEAVPKSKPTDLGGGENDGKNPVLTQGC